MNILFLSTWFPFPPDNGSKIRTCYLLRALAKIHRVSLVAFNPDPQTEFAVPENVTIYLVHVDPFRYVQLPQILKYLSPLPLVFWRVKEMETTLERLRHQEKWDVVVAFQAPAAQYAFGFDGIPCLIDIDTSSSYRMHERYKNQTSTLARLRAWVSWQKTQRYERNMLRRADKCTVVSTKEIPFLEAIVEGSGCQVALSPNGVDCTHNRPSLAEVQPYALVYNGALTYSANYDAMQWFLAEIYPLIKQQVPEVALTITGSTQGVDLSGLRLDDSVYLTGYVEDVRLPVAHSAVCVIPLRQGGGTRLKILEAMALGTPVVSTSKGAEGLEVADGEHLLIADEPAAFAAQTMRLMCDAVLSQKLIGNARALVETRYDWEQIGDAFVRLVEETAEKHLIKQQSEAL